MSVLPISQKNTRAVRNKTPGKLLATTKVDNRKMPLNEYKYVIKAHRIVQVRILSKLYICPQALETFKHLTGSKIRYFRVILL